MFSSVTEQQAVSPAQQEILQNGLLNSGFSCILQMPTGSGKTWLAEQAIATVLNKGRRAIYVTPLRALAEELNGRWRQRFVADKVGVFTGDYGNSFYPVPYRQAQLLVMTPEKLDACTRNWRTHWNWIPEVDLLVVDEFHLLGDSGRGARLEGTILRLLRLNPFLRIIGLSATLGNRQELADWLGGIAYFSTWRPIPLSWKVARYKRAQDKPELLLREVRRNLNQGGKSLVFVQSRRRAEELAQLLQNNEVKAQHHHAGLTHDSRHQVEGLFRNDQLDVLVATATLEMGLNLPARQVILYDLQVFNGDGFTSLPVNSVWQRAGRAGRPGLDEEGEVVLIAPSWDGSAKDYEKGKFEPIRSGLIDAGALAEQILAEVASGLCKYPTQLEAIFNRSLASYQNKRPPVQKTIAEMLESGMLQEIEVEGIFKLKATRLGKVAVRHLLTPKTVLLFRRIFENCEELTYLDLLIVIASSGDCEPVLPVDFEQLEALDLELQNEPTFLLQYSSFELQELLNLNPRELLTAIHTALAVRSWTRLGNLEEAAQIRGCYVFEIYRLRESASRLLQAMSAVLSAIAPPDSEQQQLFDDPETIPLSERVSSLWRMVEGGLDEQAATLTVIPSLGAKRANYLKRFGVNDLEDLALAHVADLSEIPGISTKRATNWINSAAEIVDTHWSAYRYREEPTPHQLTSLNFPSDIDPYRLRRALSLQATMQGEDTYRVTGGLDPHLVAYRKGAFICDCFDFERGHTCKHILAVRLKQGDSTLQKLSNRAETCSENRGLNLLELWMSN